MRRPSGGSRCVMHDALLKHGSSWHDAATLKPSQAIMPGSPGWAGPFLPLLLLVAAAAVGLPAPCRAQVSSMRSLQAAVCVGRRSACRAVAAARGSGGQPNLPGRGPTVNPHYPHCRRMLARLSWVRWRPTPLLPPPTRPLPALPRRPAPCPLRWRRPTLQWSAPR